MEPLEYTDGFSFWDTGFDPTLENDPSPASIGTVTAAFGVDRNGTGFGSLEEYLPELSVKLEQQGYSSMIKMPQIASFSPGHPYSGLEYGFMSGPDKEAIQLVYIGGRFQEVFRSALIEAGGVSTMFEETNPYLNGNMDLFCPYALYSPQYATMTSSTAEDTCTSTTTNTYYDQTSEEDDKERTLAIVLVLVFGTCSFGLLLYVIALLRQANHLVEASVTSSRPTKISVEKTAVSSSGDSTLRTPLL